MVMFFQTYNSSRNEGYAGNVFQHYQRKHLQNIVNKCCSNALYACVWVPHADFSKTAT